MTDTVTISIVTPSYNQGEFLAATIESVLGQEGEFAIDYLIVDGGSTDNSVAVMRRYQSLLETGEWPVKCRGISYRWLSERDKGQSDALAKGFASVRGEILAWLNSDDCYLPGALQAAVDHFAAHPDTALLYGDAHYSDVGGTIIGRYRTEPFNYQKLAWFNFICQPSTFFSREAFLAVGGVDSSLRFAIDYDLWIRMARRFPCRYLPRFLSVYRLHEASKTVRDETLYENSEEALRLALKYFGWAPLTRVYNSCNFYCRAKLPRVLAGNRVLLLVATIACSIIRSLLLNRGIRRQDLALLLDKENFTKLFKSRLEIMTGGKDAGGKK
ncbi:MAG TPA: glycosyltransferase family 2 protein [Geomonas sp.]|nr:glycosyltransferase family 2 protein [Geomonas sp.]